MNIRKFEDKDYKKVSLWWATHGWAIVPKESLPRTGLIVNEIVAGWIYKTDSDIAWIEWIISDKFSDKDLRRESTGILINSLIKVGKESGYKKFFTSSNHPSLIETYQSCGFNKTDDNVVHFILKDE